MDGPVCVRYKLEFLSVVTTLRSGEIRMYLDLRLRYGIMDDEC